MKIIYSVVQVAALMTSAALYAKAPPTAPSAANGSYNRIDYKSPNLSFSLVREAKGWAARRTRSGKFFSSHADSKSRKNYAALYEELRREVYASAKSRARPAGCPVALAELRFSGQWNRSYSFCPADTKDAAIMAKVDTIAIYIGQQRRPYWYRPSARR